MLAPRLRFILSLALVLGTGIVIACGFDFPTMLTQDRRQTLQQPVEGNFLYDAQHLVAAPLRILPGAPAGGNDENIGEVTIEQERANAEGRGLPKEQAAQIRRMRQAADGDAAYSLGQGLPEDVRLYTAAAVDFGIAHSGRAATCPAKLAPSKLEACLKQQTLISSRAAQNARQRFQAVLALPAPRRQLRGVWAAYSLARTEREDTGNVAQHSIDMHFELARQLALTGAPDPLFLALDSYGAQAASHLDRQDYAGAIELYAEQASHGSIGATASLKMMAQALLRDQALLARNIGNPLVQRLLIRYLLAYGGDDDAADGAQPNAPQPSTGEHPATTSPRRLQGLLTALERAGISTPADGDRLAAAAYAQGNFPAARKYAAHNDTALAQWVQAKLALREGHAEEARLHFASALKNPVSSISPDRLLWLQAENGTLLLSHGDILLAFNEFYGVAGKYWNDTAYLAERVLTTDELKAFVDARVPRPNLPPQAKSALDRTFNPHQEPGAEWPAFSPAVQLRDLLARRLMREGRHDEALDYFHAASDPHFEPRVDVREQAHAYILALRRAEHAWTSTGRAESLYEAAQIARWHGMEIMGYELGPDWYVYGGDGEDVVLPPARDKLAASAEVQRFASTRPTIDKRFHYRYIAAQLAMQAAESLPPRSLTYGQVHANAFSWLKYRDPDEAQTIYRHYLRYGAAGAFNATPPDFWNARLFWMRHAVSRLASGRLHAIFHGHAMAASLLLAGGLMVVAATGITFVRRKRTAKLKSYR